MSDRIAYAPFKDLVVSADEAAKFVNNGDRVGISGFTGAGYPKALPTAIAEKAKAAHAAGEEFKIDLFSGASTAPDCDGVLAEARRLVRGASESAASAGVEAGASSAILAE